MKRLILLLLIGLLTIAPLLFAAEAQLPKPAELPVEVTASKLEALQQQRQAIFSGEVVAKQGDITLYSDKLIVFLLPDQDQVERMEATGKVRVIQLDRTATADRAVYHQQQGTLLLYGNAKVHQGQNEISGEEIIVYLQEDRSVVKSGDTGRVKAILFPKQEQQ